MAEKGVGGPGPVGGDGEPGSEPDRGAPVSGELVWKARAQEAQEKAEMLEARVSELEAQLASAGEAIRAVERRAEIDRELTAARAIDMETARLLTEATIGEMDEPDIAIAVRELCDRKPFLFASRGAHPGGGLAMRPAGAGSGYGPGSGLGDDEIETMARRARSSGDRSELLRYLRVRRGP